MLLVSFYDIATHTGVYENTTIRSISLIIPLYVKRKAVKQKMTTQAANKYSRGIVGNSCTPNHMAA